MRADLDVCPTAYTNPLQQRYERVKAEMRTLRAELLDLKRKLQEGVCEVCGITFTRLRPTKRVCSQRCQMAAHVKRFAMYDLGLIRRQLPSIEASGLMGITAITQVRMAIDGSNASEIGEALALSTQAISRVLYKAHRLASAFEAIAIAQRSQVQPSAGE